MGLLKYVPLFGYQAGGVTIERLTSMYQCDILDVDFKKKYFWGDFLFFSHYIQHCFICRPSDSTVPTDAGIEPRTVATGALPVRRSNH